MGKATETELAELHSTLTRTLTQAVKPQEIIQEDGRIDVIMPAAAYLTAAIMHLKNNNITADPETNSDLAELNKTLAERRKRKKLSLSDMSEVVDALERDLPGHMQ